MGLAASRLDDGASVSDTTAESDAHLLVGRALDDMQTTLLSQVTEAWSKAGGPVQYLVARYSSQKDKEEFADALSTEFPKVPTLTYHSTCPVPVTMSPTGGCDPRAGGCDPHAPLCLHPALFAFGVEASMKTLPELNVALRLAEEMLLGGFQSHTEPVQITVVKVPNLSEQPESPLPIQSIGYIKGQARVCTLLGLFSFMIDAKVNVAAALPNLYGTAWAIHYGVYATK